MSGPESLARQRTLVSALAAAMGAQVFETHISWVLVGGAIACKFKKAVRFDFLDFSTLDARRRYCEEEMRLNGRLAPDIYQEVVAITGTPEQPVIGGTGAPIEYAVKMRAFPQEALWSHRLRQGLLSADEMDGLAASLARFHANTAVAQAGSPWCTPAALEAIGDETLNVVTAGLGASEAAATVRTVLEWEKRLRAQLRERFIARKAGGHIRECHGDLHCRNILTLDGHVEAFDCIEFNEGLRWIDVMNDIAFVCMDLRFHQRGDLAARLLNGYLEITGDYEGLRVFPYYETHRALIRCKVALLRHEQCPPQSDGGRDAMREALAYLDFAAARITRQKPSLLIVHGFSGSGKSTVARAIVEAIDAIRLRSDVERKRMLGIAAESHDAAGSALYAARVTQQTYERLLALAETVLESGWTVVVDAAFLRAAQRDLFRALAGRLGVPFRILDIQASEATMRARIIERQRSGADPSDAGVEVLALQLRHHDALTQEEWAYVSVIDTEATMTPEILREACKAE